MDFTIKREMILQPLQHMVNLLDKKQSIPILLNVLFIVKESRIEMVVTDLESEIVFSIQNQCIRKNGTVTIPAKKLLDVCRVLPSGSEISITLENNFAKIQHNESKFLLPTLESIDFPRLEESEFNHSFSLQQNELQTLLKKTSFAMAMQDLRYFLNGLFLEFKEGKVIGVATDGHRLAYSFFETKENSFPSNLQAIVPRKCIQELISILENNSKSVQVNVGVNHICFSTEHYRYISKLIEGRYPNYMKVFPTNKHNYLVVDRELLKFALVRTSIICHEDSHGICISIKPDQMSIHAINHENEEADEKLEIQYQGEAIELGINIQYLMDVINTFSSDVKTVRFYFENARSSLLIDSEDDSNSSFVVMPMAF